MAQHETETRRSIGALLRTIIHGFGLLLVVLVGIYTYLAGRLGAFLIYLPFASLLVVGAVRLWGLVRKELAWSFIRRPLQRENHRYALQALLQWIFWLSLVFALHLSFPVHPYGAEVAKAFFMMMWIVAGALMLLALVPNKKLRPSTTIFFAVGSLYLWIELGRILWPSPATDTVVLDPPFRGEWLVFHGGRSAIVNYHVAARSQRHALDILQPLQVGPEGEISRALEAYPAFGQTLYAPAAGRVVKAVQDRPDVEIGKTDREQIAGNHVVIEIGEGRYVFMAHLMQNSILVRPGDVVRSGQAIGRCGNSGNTSEPHLHLQVQSHPDLGAKGQRTYPICIRGARRRDGRMERLECADLRRNDVILGE